jgi:TPR repeat protein
MKANRLIWAVFFLWVGTTLQSSAQESAADRKRLDGIKARADKGDTEAQLELAELYVVGDGVAKDPAKAAKLRRKAAEQGSARAQCLLGLQYADGEGVKKNMADAVYWLGKAADQGLAEAQHDLGMCFASGEVPGRTIGDAVELYRKAADQGLPQAEAMLGECYFDGAGVPKNIPEGLKWTQKAAEQGNPSAQRALGICYAKGRGVSTNYVHAYKWLALAAAKDNRNSDDIRVNLSMVERFMTPEQIAEGQRLAHEFLPGGAATPGGAPSPASSPDSRPTSAGPAQASTSTPVGASAPARPPKTGLVNVKADDDTQEIFVDSAFVGNAPAKLQLAEGPHLIEVKKAGFKDYRKQIQVGEGSELTLRVILEKK